MQGSLQELAVYKTDNGHSIIIRNGKEVLIPASEQKGLLREMHSTHLESAMMKRLSRGRFFWPGITKDIENEYKQCMDCRVEGISKANKPCQVIPEDLTILALAEQISVDFAESGIIKDNVSGFLEVVKARHQTTVSAI